MGGVRRKKSRKNATINILKGTRKRKQKRVKPYIGNKVLEKNWDNKKTLQQNMRNMGLAYNPNSAVKKSKKKGLKKNDEMEVEQEVKTPTAVIEEFEKQAANGKKFERHISPDESKFLMGLMKSHKTNYQSMCKDKRNTYQHTANQLRKKCEGLLNSSLLPKYKEMFPELSPEEGMEL